MLGSAHHTWFKAAKQSLQSCPKRFQMSTLLPTVQSLLVTMQPSKDFIHNHTSVPIMHLQSSQALQKLSPLLECLPAFPTMHHE